MKTRIVLLSLLIVSMAFTVPSAIIADSSIVGLWHFDEGSGTTASDSSGYAYPGTIHGAEWVTSINGKALSFDGLDDYVSIPDVPQLDHQTEATFEYWVKYRCDPSPEHEYFLCGYVKSHDGAAIRLGRRKYEIFINAGTLRPDGSTNVFIGYQFYNNVWYQLALTIKVGDKWQVFVNGVLIESGTIGLPDTVIETGCEWGIGASSEPDNYPPQHYVAGDIDEVHVYNRALTAAEIEQSYINGRTRYIDGKTQYYLTVNNGGHGTACGEGWYDAGSYVHFWMEPIGSPPTIDLGTGTRYVFTGWVGSEGGYTGPSGSGSDQWYLNSPITETAQWKTQHYLQVSSVDDMGSISPSSEWFDAGAPVTIQASAPDIIYPEDQERYVWNGWTGSGEGSYTGMDNPATITMNGPIIETASWTHQYYQVIGTDPAGIVAITPVSGWYDDGATFSLTAPLGSYTWIDGYQYFFLEWLEDGTYHQRGVNTLFLNGLHCPHAGYGGGYIAHYITPQKLVFSWTGPTVVKKGSTGHYSVNYKITIPSAPTVPMNPYSPGPSGPSVDLTSVKVQGSIGTKAKNIYIYLDGTLIGYLPSLKTASWSISSSKLKLDVSKDVITLKIPKLNEGQSHTLTIKFDWAFTSTGTERITGPWSAVCTSMFGTLKTPHTDVITVRIDNNSP